MTTREQVDALAEALLAANGDRFAAVRDRMFTLIDAATADGHPQSTEPIAVASPERADVLCVFACTCIGASEGQPITLIATKLSAVARDEESTAPTDAEALAFSLALLGDAWFSQSLRDAAEIADPARPTKGVRLYLSGDFQPGVPEVFSDSVVPTVSTLD
ncbi:hypothetical protein ASE16_12535 [Leifsonia sp. Root227]|uniref:hypothetical protein n=1 Tax=unclassified Leifsonia TaxID=2663824 RepID=UPI0007014A1C|nr:hypothetical protein [Leifsonia sp. Root227]KRC49548.1 hypothetical protein ASE16_12535 [Leifsonia sp. Root227]